MPRGQWMVSCREIHHSGKLLISSSKLTTCTKYPSPRLLNSCEQTWAQGGKINASGNKTSSPKASCPIVLGRIHPRILEDGHATTRINVVSCRRDLRGKIEYRPSARQPVYFSGKFLGREGYRETTSLFNLGGTLTVSLLPFQIRRPG